MSQLDKGRSGDGTTSVLLALAFITCMTLISLTVWTLLGLILQF
jgi:hypothetical protein